MVVLISIAIYAICSLISFFLLHTVEKPQSMLDKQYDIANVISGTILSPITIIGAICVAVVVGFGSLLTKIFKL